MNWSRLISILSVISGTAAYAGGIVGAWKPGAGHLITTIALGIAGFTEKIQGAQPKP